VQLQGQAGQGKYDSRGVMHTKGGERLCECVQ
jgi:hypothetical protein